MLTLEVRRAGESRKSAGFRPPGMLKKDEGDTGGGDSGRDGGVMALYLDAPPAAAAEPPSMTVKLVLANENDPGLEFAGASMLPDDDVVIGEDRKRREASHSSRSIKPAAAATTGRVHGGVASCTSGLAGTVEEGDEVGEEEVEVEGTRGALDFVWTELPGGLYRLGEFDC